MRKLVFTLVVSFVAASAHGQTINATFNTVNPVLTVTGTFDNTNFHNQASGVAQFSSPNGSFLAFCVEPLQSINFGESLTYQVQSPFALPNNDQIARVITAYLASSQTAAEAAGAQWAIWELTNETLLSPSLLDGSNRITTPAFASTQILADQYLATIYNFSPVALAYLTNPSRQDFVTWDTAVVIPEPASIALAALAGLGVLRRRRN